MGFDEEKHDKQRLVRASTSDFLDQGCCIIFILSISFLVLSVLGIVKIIDKII